MRAKRKKRRKHEECTWIRWKIGNWNSRYFAPVCRTFVFTFNPLFPLLVSKQKRKLVFEALKYEIIYFHLSDLHRNSFESFELIDINELI